MLNGKFYTGLPPKMLERNAGVQNRLESHLFWPDDSKTESANDIRLKRRSSLQANSTREPSFQRQTSWNGGKNDDVDTKQRFHKEFAKSSIQFCDNIQEEEMDSGRRQQAIRKPHLRKTLKQDIAIKPTALNMKQQRNDTAQEEYAAIKKNQAFSSKIQFYDYVDNDERQNNKMKPKMDMNDKKDVERYTKNSPKLQVKAIVRNIRIVDEQRNNDRNHTPERNYDDYEETERPRYKKPIVRNEVRGENNNRQGERFMHHQSYRQHNDYDYNNAEPDYDEMPQQYNATTKAQNLPKRRILKNPARDERDFEEQGATYNDLEYMERAARNMRINTSPKKHVTYGDEVYEYEQHNGNYHTNDRAPENNTESGRTVRNATYSSRNEMKSTNRSTTGNNQRQQQNRPNISDYETNVVTNYEDQYINDRTVGNNASKKPLSYNNNNNRDTTKLNNLSQQRKITPKITTSSMTKASNESALSPTMDVQKHLRSSLHFSGGEIVANDRAEAGSDTPTSEPSSRRTARSAATTRRICVGLPD